MWGAIYALIILVGTGLAVWNSIVSMAAKEYGFAIGYVLIILFASSTMWILGKSVFGKTKE